MALLLMENICKSFFDNQVLKEVNLTIEEGEVHALLGENGAGKTTLMNILYGIYKKEGGSMTWQDCPLELDSPKDAIDQGIGMVHQHFMLVPNLTVSENITLGLKSKGYPLVDRKKIDETIRQISDRYGLHIDPRAYIYDLSVGEQQRVEIIKLLYRNAKLLILDEPTAVLTPQETDNLFSVLRRLKAEGHSVIVITHKIPEVMSVTDRITILRDGANAATVTTQDTTETDLAKHMIGRELKPAKKRSAPVCEGEGLILKDVSLGEEDRQSLKDISLCVDKGKIVGVAGVDGNGQKELAEVITGIVKHSRGKIELDGQILDDWSVMKRKKHGLGYIPSDRHRDAMILDMGLADNMLLNLHTDEDFVSRGIIQHKKVRRHTADMVDAYGVRTPSIRTPIRYLSGGNQQKLILAREMEGSPKVVVAFQPTRGLDISATEFTRKKLLDHREAGCCVLLISTDLEEILEISDEICVLYEGKIMDMMANDDKIDIDQIGLLMAGKEVDSEKA